MGGCTDIPETDFRAPLSASPGSPSLGTELARLELRLRSEWSSLRLLRILPCGSLMLLLRQSRLITFWDTASSKRCRCFLGMNILANMVACEEKKRNNIDSGPQLKKRGRKHQRGTSSPQERTLEFQFHHIWSNSDIQHKKVTINSMESSKWRVILINRLSPSTRLELKARGIKKGFDGEAVFLSSSQRWREPERRDLSQRRETVRKRWRHSLLAGVSLLQREIPQTEHGERERKKKCGSERAWDFSLSLSASIRTISFSPSRSFTSVHASPLCHCPYEPRAGSWW